MNIFHPLLSLLYNLNFKYDKMPSKMKGFFIAEIMIVSILASVFVQVIISLTLNTGYFTLFFSALACIVGLMAISRFSYKKGRLNNYMPASTYFNEEIMKRLIQHLDGFKGVEKIEEGKLLIEVLRETNLYASLFCPGKHYSLNEKRKKEIDRSISEYIAFVNLLIKAKKNKNFQKNNEKFYEQQHSFDYRIPYLKVLGLDRFATAEQIKATYRKLAMKWHPDRNKDPKAEENFKMIKSAYEKLC